MTRDDIAAAVEAVVPGALADLRRLVRIPSIWADPAHAEDTEASAALVAELVSALNPESVRILRAPGGAPAVVAQWPAPEGPQCR